MSVQVYSILTLQGSGSPAKKNEAKESNTVSFHLDAKNRRAASTMQVLVNSQFSVTFTQTVVWTFPTLTADCACVNRHDLNLFDLTHQLPHLFVNFVSGNLRWGFPILCSGEF